MFTAYQFGMLALEFVLMIVAVWGVVSRSQFSLKTELQTSITDVSKAHAESLKESREQFSTMNENFKQVGLQINTILQGDVRELRGRVERLESGQDEWTKELRQRTHDLAEHVNKLGFAIELLKAAQAAQAARKDS